MHLPSWNVLIQVTIIGILTGGVYALMATGLTLIFGVMRVINIAHGAFLIFSAYITYWLFTSYGVDPFLSVIVSVPILFLIGVIFQRYVLSRVKGDAGLGVLLTFAMALTLEGVMGSLWASTGRSVRTSYTSEVFKLQLSDLALRLPWVRVGGLFAAIVALGAIFLLLRYTNLGRAIRATIQNRSAAQLMGAESLSCPVDGRECGKSSGDDFWNRLGNCCCGWGTFQPDLDF